jgi:hypothetical protein
MHPLLLSGLNHVCVGILVKPNKDDIVRPVATYASETWTFTKADKRALGLFERSSGVLLSCAQDKGQWRTYIYKLYEPDLVKYIEIN